MRCDVSWFKLIETIDIVLCPDWMHVQRPGWGIAVCGSCSVVGLRWRADVYRACVPLVVSCSSSCLLMYSEPSRLFVTQQFASSRDFKDCCPASYCSRRAAVSERTCARIVRRVKVGKCWRSLQFLGIAGGFIRVAVVCDATCS